MRSVTEHRAAVVALAAPLPPVAVGLLDGLGCALAEPVRAATALPPYDASAMDGYGVRAADLAEVPVTLAVVDSAPAGSPVTSTDLPSASCVRILTGGLVPAYVDAVVPVEDTDGGRGQVVVRTSVVAGTHIRRAGEECAAGTVILPAGRVLNAAAVMAAAAAGAATVTVVRRPRVAIVSTGDELVAAGSALGVGQLHDSNGPGLAAAVMACGGAVVAVRHAPDDIAAVTALLRDLAKDADLIITTGGVSAGAENDPIKAAFAGDPAVDFVSVAMQPGKPQAAGRIGDAVFLGFPGNPVSALASWAIFGLPVLRRLAGRDPQASRQTAVLARSVQPLPTRQRYVRAQLSAAADGVVHADPVDGYGSHLVGGLGQTDCFIELPPGDEPVPAGGVVAVVVLSEPSFTPGDSMSQVTA